MQHACNSNSEDSLTWSCFDVLRNCPLDKTVAALDEIFEDAYGGNCPVSFIDEKNVEIHIGKRYSTPSGKESTEVDASIETDNKLIFFEAKLYGSIEMPDEKTPFDQIIKKLRVGSDVAHEAGKEFYFIFLDIAPIEQLLSLQGSSKFAKKRESAYRFNLYKTDPDSLSAELIGVSHPATADIARNMGWLTWSCLFKTVLRITVKN
jgi:hypothetical protein